MMDARIWWVAHTGETQRVATKKKRHTAWGRGGNGYARQRHDTIGCPSRSHDHQPIGSYRHGVLKDT
ncbi:hypothetical protein EBZ35_00575 [bacterium]|nr:hypothetical protein [bacterium]